MAVDGWYYVFQLINFPISAIIFGVAVNNLWREVETNGWVVSARLVWACCFIVSTFTFLILQLDPSASLGLIPPPWRTFLAFFDSSLVINTIYATLYMYLIVLSKRHLQEVPRLHTYLWVGINVVSTTAIGVFCLIGAITNNHFWLAIGLVGLVTQELLLLVASNVNLYRVSQLFNELEATTHTSYAMQRKKLMIIQIIFNALIVIAIVSSLIVKNAGLNALWSPVRVPAVAYNPEVFDIFYLMPDWLIMGMHVILLYAMRRPNTSKDKSNMVNLSIGGGNSTSGGGGGGKGSRGDSTLVVVTTTKA